MRSEHKRVRLGECVDLLTGFPFRSAGYSDAESSVRLLRGDNVAQGVLRWEDAKRWPHGTYDELLAYSLREDDVVLAMDRPWIAAGLKFAHVRKVDLPCLLVQRVARLRARSGLDSRYLRYVIGGRQFTDYILSVQTGTAVPHISTGQIAAFEFLLPPMREQRMVGELLGVLDDRVDLLRQTNFTLESIAQALFKSWFIDFDPVRAKSEGREPEGMDAVTAALFPAEFEESALGLIPKGWAISVLADHVIAERGLSYKGAGLCGAREGLPMHNLNSVLEGGGYKYSGIKYYRGEYKDRHVAVAGDVIVANTEQGHEHRLIGFPAIIPSRYVKAIYSHHIYRARLKPESSLSTHTLYYTLMAPAVREAVIGCANGSTVNMLKIAGLQMPRFICPPRGVAQAFEAIAFSIRQQIEANIERAETLSALRDALLPRLVSGRLRMPLYS